jgi:hypothetical protein
MLRKYTIIGMLSLTTLWGAGVTSETFGKIVSSGCESGFSNMFKNNQNFQDINDQRPITPKEVCECTQTNFLNDKKLLNYLNNNGDQLVKMFQNKNSLAYSYFSIRLSQSMLSCIAQELDKSLIATKLQ